MVNRVGGIYPGQEQFGLDQGDGQVIHIKVVKLQNVSIKICQRSLRLRGT